MGLFRLLARVTIGLLFVGHGTQKLFGWFGGGGLEGTAGNFEKMGLLPGRRNALAAGSSETARRRDVRRGRRDAAGGGRALGLDDHRDQDGHWAEGAVDAARAATSTTSCCSPAVFGLTENGPGRWSLDGARGRSRWGTSWAFAALIGGAAGSAATLAAAQHELAEQEAAERSARRSEPAAPAMA